MLFSALLAATVSVLIAAQSSSPVPPSQTTTGASAPSESVPPYPGVQANKPGFQVIYPKNGSYWSIQPLQSQPYPWGPGPRELWPAIIEIPEAYASKQLAIGVLSANTSKLYFGHINQANSTLSPKPNHPATNKTWPADWYWNNFTTDPEYLAGSHSNPVIVPGSGYYVAVFDYNSTVYAVSELFELRETKTEDPSLPPGPYGRVTAGAISSSRLSITLICLSGAVGLWALL